MIALAFCLAVFGARRASWMIVPSFNAVPQGEHTTEVSLPACEAAASADGCAQFSFNLHSGHCYRSNSTSFSGIASDHVTSGCDIVIFTDGPDKRAGNTWCKLGSKCDHAPPPPATRGGGEDGGTGP